MSTVTMKPVELECLGSDPVGLNLVGHQDEPVVARGALVLEILDDDRVIGHSLRFVEHHLRSLPTIQTGFSAVPSGAPFHRGIFGDRERIPLLILYAMLKRQKRSSPCSP